MNDALSFQYERDDQPLGMFKSALVLLFVLPLIFGLVSLTTGKLHETAATTPGLSFAVHLLTTCMLLCVLSYLLALSMDVAAASANETSFSQSHSLDRRIFTNVGLIYAMMTVSYSPIILYTPKPQEQTLHISETTGAKYLGRGTCEKITKAIKSKRVRDCCAVVYFLGILLQGCSIYALYNALREFLATDIETTLSIVIVYVVLVLVYSVAFITAIYELRPILRIDHQRGVITKAYPKALQHLRKQSKQLDPRKVLFYNNQRGKHVKAAVGTNKGGQLYIYNEVSNDFDNIRGFKVDDVLSDEKFNVQEGSVVVLKIHRRRKNRKDVYNDVYNDVYIWKIGTINEDGGIQLIQPPSTNDDSDEEEDKLLEEAEEGYRRSPLFEAESDTPTTLTTTTLSSLCNCCKPNITVGRVKKTATPTPIHPSTTTSTANMMSKLKDGTNFQKCSLDGTLYLMKKFNKKSFRFMEIGYMDKGAVVQRQNIALLWIGYLFAFDDGDALDPSIDWQPNLVESMRAQGWINFDHCGRCCRGSNCGKWHLGLMGVLSGCWAGIIITQLVHSVHPDSGVGSITVLISVVELLLVVALSIATFIVDTDVDEDDQVQGYEHRKLIQDKAATSRWVEKNMEENDNEDAEVDDEEDGQWEKKTEPSVNSSAAATLQLDKLKEIQKEYSKNTTTSASSAVVNVNEVQRGEKVSDRTITTRGQKTSTAHGGGGVQTRGTAMKKVTFHVAPTGKIVEDNLKGDNSTKSKIQTQILSGDTGCNIICLDFINSLQSEESSNQCVHITFEFQHNDSNQPPAVPINVAIGMIRCGQNGELPSMPTSTIGNTSNAMDSFGIHGDDGSHLISREDSDDAWKENNMLTPTDQTWWPTGGLLTTSIRVSIGFDNATKQFYVICPGYDQQNLQEINGLLPEWFAADDDEGVYFCPVISFEYEDSVVEASAKSAIFMTVECDRNQF